MSTCSAAHDKSTEAPVPLPEASAARLPVTAVVAGDRFLLRSILYIDPKKQLLATKLNISASLYICAHVTVYVHPLLLRSITHAPLCRQEHSDDRWML